MSVLSHAKRHTYGRASENIYGTLKATVDTDEYIVLGAHFDSVKNSPGANDNASGVVLVYFVALQLVAQKKRTKNFVFVFFDEEENNLIGRRSRSASRKTGTPARRFASARSPR